TTLGRDTLSVLMARLASAPACEAHHSEVPVSRASRASEPGCKAHHCEPAALPAFPARRDRRSPTCLPRAYSVRQPTGPASSAHQTQLPGFMLFPTTSASSRKPLTLRPLLAFSGGMSSSKARLRPT